MYGMHLNIVVMSVLFCVNKDIILYFIADDDSSGAIHLPFDKEKKKKSPSKASTSLNDIIVLADIRRSPRKHNITRTPGTPTGKWLIMDRYQLYRYTINRKYHTLFVKLAMY